MKKQLFGTTKNGSPVYEYTLTNGTGAEVKVITYGGIITAVNVPDRDGVIQNVALGCNHLAAYESQNAYFGCVAGRYANRIARGKFSLDGKTYQLATNDGPNHLHGGPQGFHTKIWEVVNEIKSTSEEGLELHYFSPDGEESYPGNLNIAMTYLLTDQNELRIEYRATTDAPTLVNPTNHSYWNLTGEGSGSVMNHLLQLNADHFTPVDATAIPLGDLAPVAGTPFDFREPKAIGAEIRSNDPQIAFGHGYDHNWIIRRSSLDDTTLIKAAELVDPTSGRSMEVWTTEPGIQFYSGNFLNASLYGPGGHAYRQSDGAALETQHFPDSPNRPAFPSTILRPGEKFFSSTVYKFGVSS